MHRRGQEPMHAGDRMAACGNTLDKYNADLVAAPPLDAGIAPFGVSRQQQSE